MSAELAQTYVRAAKHRSDDASDHRTHVTGRVLHLALFAYDQPGVALLYGTGRWVPLCGGRGRRVETWRVTGPWAEHWQGHAHWQPCSACVRKLEELGAALGAQTDRWARHEETREEATA